MELSGGVVSDGSGEVAGVRNDILMPFEYAATKTRAPVRYRRSLGRSGEVMPS